MNDRAMRSPIAGQKALFGDEQVGTAESANADFDLRGLLLTGLDQLAEVPHIETLFELRSLCEPGKSDCEFWQWAAINAANDLCGCDLNDSPNAHVFACSVLSQRRYFEWGQPESVPSLEQADAAICGEINQFLNRVLNSGDDMARQSKPKEPTMTREPSNFDQVKQSEFAALKARGKSQVKEIPSKGSLTASIIQIPLAKIVDSPFQTREEPDDDVIQRRADSFAKDGQRDPIRVRSVGSKYELIAGHIRTRAARLLKWPTIAAVEFVATDAEAARAVFDDNEQREDLNQIERARGLQVVWERYQAEGKSMDTMAADLGIDQSTISNRLRLLKAPASLQKRLISGEISESRLRDLAKWATRDGLLERFEKELHMRSSEGPVNNYHWNSALKTAIEQLSKPVTKHSYHYPGDPLFDASKYTEELDVVEVKIDGQTERRAFNVKRWKQLQAEAQKKQKVKQAVKAANEISGGSKSKPKRTDRKAYPFQNALREAWVEPYWTAIGKVIKGKLTKPQIAVAGRLILLLEFPFNIEAVCDSINKSEAEWNDCCLTALRKDWDRNQPWEIEPLDVIRLGEYFGVDLVAEWKPSARLLNACSLLDLQDFAGELNVEKSLPRDELVQMLEQCWRPGCVPELFMIDVPKPKKGKVPK